MNLRFIDTNIVLYSISQAPREVRKREVAVAILDRPDNAVSVQVLQEFYAAATRPGGSAGVPHADALAVALGLRRYAVQPMTLAIFEAAMEIKAAYRFSYWDSAILAAARALGCSDVLTEDMQHGQIVDGLRISNPFRP